ncbi:hypothetical protein [Paraburkholderia caballeronis]|uniref:Uncharacterized protein n=1 Tax=Paraburkholderia caballeronis TaxID=416943 RepID=A0A1H7TYT1_9BURK|nr:hypothetical protein [Paraburkholderia caballeronis]PXW23387.1 hypothetical protein C7403_110125 [Paraburkholderia caballeronis]PXW98380.1 hypothetical protein C7407_110125 [Paraburkholderia caballeronis]RAJ95111.1 hypothetical protein C7409_110126 [Paraburkholderia caballeronis]SEC56595.1 hypothetical protein SAMN05445871_2435 [Paraburkholderia caballeronis]SEL89618.1 hypothetical protein SAMN05192542_11715 [Paraburkholderia caballeronis]
MKNFNDLMQLALPVLMEIPKPRLLEEGLVESCDDYGDAIRLCLDKRIRRVRESEIAEYLGFSAPHLTKVKNGQGYLTTDQELVLQHLCSNWAISQYAEMRKSQLAELIDSPAAKIARLEAELAKYRSAA